VVIFQIKLGNPRELTELVGDGTSETVAAQIQKGESDQHGHVCRDGTNEVVVAEVKPGEVLELGGAEGIKRAVDPRTGKAERSNVASTVAGDSEPGAS
jgi:hypothetical protein